MNQKLVERTVRRTREISRNKNFPVAMRDAVDEARLPEEQRAELLHIVAQFFGKKSAEARTRKEIIREFNKAMHKQRIAEELAESAYEANEHICPID